MSIFNSVPQSYKVRVNKFNLNKEVLTTGEIGTLYPVFSEIMLPNTYYKVSPNVKIKSCPMFAPIYSGLRCDFHAFAVPLRLLWDKFDDWIFDPSNTTDLPPHITQKDLLDIINAAGSTHSLCHDLGIPSQEAIHLGSSISPGNKFENEKPVVIWDFLAYHKIYNEYFRNEELQVPSEFCEDISIQDYKTYWIANEGLSAFIKFFNRNYSKDYFTSCLTSTQRGGNALLSVLTQLKVPVTFDLGADALADTKGVLGINATTGSPYVSPYSLPLNNPSSDTSTIQTATGQNFPLDVYTDLTNANNGISVNDLRALFAVQSYLEQNLQGGSRYPEGVLSFYGTRVNDLRAQRPEFLGVCSTTIEPSEVVAHDASDLGQLGAFSNALGLGRSFRYYATEHTLFMIIMSFKPKGLYCQGLKKRWFAVDQFDYPIPLFQHIGEEPVYNHELFYYPGDNKDFDVFGYQSRFADWRSTFDEIRGDFVSSLSDWHFGRIFRQRPKLDSTFITVDPTGNNDTSEQPLNRVFNYSGKAVDHYWIDIYFLWSAKLPFRYHSKPMLIG